MWRFLHLKYRNTQFEYEEIPVSSERRLPEAPYPRQYVHCAFSELERVVRAVYGLRAAGYPASDIHVLTSWDFVETVEREQQQQNSLLRAFRRLSSSIDEGFGDTYLRAARRGEHILAVRVPEKERLAQVRDLLAFHRARLIKYVDTWTVMDLTPPLALQWALSVLSSSVQVPRT
jgi:hypothetical protein